MIILRELCDGGVGYASLTTPLPAIARPLTFVVQPARMGERHTQAYVNFIGQQLNGPDGGVLFNFSDRDLVERQAIITSVYAGGIDKPDNLVASRHTHLDENNMLSFRGAYVRPDFRGRKLGPALAAIALFHSHRLGHRPSAGVGAVIVRNNRPNPKSVRAMQKLNFKLSDHQGLTPVLGTYRDQHLLRHAELIDGKPFIRWRKMYLDRSKFRQAVRFLTIWHG